MDRNCALALFSTVCLGMGCVRPSSGGNVLANGSLSGSLRSASGPYELQIRMNDRALDVVEHRGDNFVMGVEGERYVLRVVNNSQRRVEAVVSVDGRDVVTGNAADYRTNRGYVVPASGYVDIEGWRFGHDINEVAVFRFSGVEESVAASSGNPRHVGVIGVAIFTERERPMLARPLERERSYDRADMADSAPSAAGAGEAPSAAAPVNADGYGSGPRSSAMKSESDHSAKPAPGIGTGAGELTRSEVDEAVFVRTDDLRPAALLGVRYNDRRGLAAMGVSLPPDPPPSDSELRHTANPFPESQPN